MRFTIRPLFALRHLRTCNKVRVIPPLYALLWAALALLLIGMGAARAVAPMQATSIYLPLVGHATTAHADYAAWSSTIVTAAADEAVWVVNPDAGSVTVIDGSTLQPQAEIATGGEPWAVALTQDGSAAFVIDRAGGRLLRIDRATLTVTGALFVGSEPGGVVLSADDQRAFVSLMAEAAVVAVDATSLDIVGRIDVASTPYALAMNGERLLVTHLFGLPIPDTVEAENNSRAGEISVINAATLQLVDEIILPPNEQGTANQMASIAVHAGRAWVPHVRASPALPNSLISTVFAAVSTLDLATNAEAPAAALHLNDQKIFGSPVNNPAAVAPSPDGRTLYLVHGGSDALEVVDIANAEQPRLVKFLSTGKNPRGIAITADGSRAFVMNYLSRTVSVYTLNPLAKVADVTVTQETLDPAVLAGKILFHNATDPRLTRGGWISCASCHFDGWPDGVTWIFPDGPRQVPMLWNAGESLPWHWSAALDEAQDVEETVHVIQHGLGLATGTDLYMLGAPLAGQSAALDQLATFLVQGIRPANVAVEGDVAAGRALFVSRGCTDCHGGAAWTTSSLPGAPGRLDPDGDGMVNSVLHDVGTYTERDLRGKGGFDVPSLLGVGLTAPYFHDGSALSLEALLTTGHPMSQGSLPPLDTAEIAALVDFLYSIGPETEALPAP